MVYSFRDYTVLKYMGNICPYSRDHGFAVKKLCPGTSEGNGATESRLYQSSDTATPRTPRRMVRITGALTSYYKKVAEERFEDGVKRFKAEHVGTKQPCDLLVVPKNGPAGNAKFRKDLQNKLNGLEHRHIAKMLQTLWDKKNFYVAFEPREYCSLDEYVSNTGCLTEPQAARVMSQVFEALAFAHARGIVHKHVSIRTVAVRRIKESGRIVVFLAGFELADLLGEDENALDHPPEGLGQLATTKTDIWRCGALVVFLLTGIRVSEECAGHRILRSYAFPAGVWTNLSTGALTFITALLQSSPEARPSALECLAHPWLRNVQPVPPVTKPSVRKQKKEEGAIKRFIASRVMEDPELAHFAEVLQSLDDRNGDVQPRSMKPGALAERVEVNGKSNQAENPDENDFFESALRHFCLRHIASEEGIRATFAVLDSNDDGLISVLELKQFLNLSSSKSKDLAWQQLMKACDSLKTKSLDLSAFQALVLASNC